MKLTKAEKKKGAPKQRSSEVASAVPPGGLPVAVTGGGKAAVSVRNVTKAYRIYDKSSSIVSEVLFGKKGHRDKVILDNINIDIRPGEVVGIIGKNGAGKSTLLKMIAGTLAPTTGKIHVQGRVSAILELGTGFNAAYSGRDNVIMSAVMRGMSETAIKAKFDSVVAFAGLEHVIDEPFHTYSSGMQARLAFAAAVAVDADVIIIDEALAAGDIRFTARSLRRVREICQSGVTALFVSHQTYHVMQLCSRAIWIDEGRIKMDGSPIEVCRAYEYEMHAAIAQDEGRLGNNGSHLQLVSDQTKNEAPPAEVAPDIIELPSEPATVEDPAPAVPAPIEPTPDKVAPVETTVAPVEPRVEVESLAAESEQQLLMVAAYQAPIESSPLPPVATPGAFWSAMRSQRADLVPHRAPSATAPAPVVAPESPPQELLVPATDETAEPAETGAALLLKAGAVVDAEKDKTQHFQSNQYRITSIQFLDKTGAETKVFKFGEMFRLRVAYECLMAEEPDVSCGLAAAFTSTPEHVAVMYFNTNYPHSDEEIQTYDEADFRQYTGKTGALEATIPFLQVKPGNYLVSLGILPNRPEAHEFYEYHHLAFGIAVLPNGYPEPSIFYAMVNWKNGPAG